MSQTQSLTPYCDTHGHAWERYTAKGQPFIGQCLRCRKWPTEAESVIAPTAPRVAEPEPVVPQAAQESLFADPKRVTF